MNTMKKLILVIVALVSASAMATATSATVTVTRVGGALGFACAQIAEVQLDFEKMGALRPKQSVTFNVEPGKHVLAVKGEGGHGLLSAVGYEPYVLRAKAGERYTYRIRATLAGFILERL
jgi:hypothetical protein